MSRLSRVRPGARGVVAIGALVAAAATVGTAGSAAGATPVRCAGATVTGSWQRLPAPTFPDVPGVSATRRLSAYAVDRSAAYRMFATDGTSMFLSDDGGCAWRPSLTLEAQPSTDSPVSGATARISSVAVLPDHRVLAVIADAGGPRAFVSGTGDPGTWSSADLGLPPGATPQALVAAPGGAYLAASSGQALPLDPGALPTPPTATAGVVSPAYGVFFFDSDAGSWQGRTPLPALPGAVTSMATASSDAADLWLVAGGRLLHSTDGGRTVAPVDPGVGTPRVVQGRTHRSVVVAGAQGLATTTDDGHTWRRTSAPDALTSLALRGVAHDVVLATTAGGRLLRIALGGGWSDVTPSGVVSAADAVGDAGDAATWHVRAVSRPGGQDVLLRWVDGSGDRFGAGGPGRLLSPPLDAPPPPPPARLDVVRAVDLAAGATRQLPLTLRLPRAPTPLDLYFLVDVSQSMFPAIDDLRANLREVIQSLVDRHVDVMVGVAIAGTNPRNGGQDPPVDPTDPSYRQPVLFRRVVAVTDPETALRALDQVRIETVSSNAPPERIQGQLLGIDQLMTGSGVRNSGGVPGWAVAPDQEAGWRQSDRTRRVLVDLTDQSFDVPPGAPRAAGGGPDLDRVGAELRAQRVLHVGLSAGPDRGARFDLGRLSALTGAIAPAGGLDCDGDRYDRLAAGAPLVCPTPVAVSKAVAAALRALPDRQAVTLTTAVVPVASGAAGATATLLTDVVDATLDNTVDGRLTVTCPTLPRRTTTRVPLEAGYQGSVVARAAVVVTCEPAARPERVPPVAAAAAPLVAALVPPGPPPPPAPAPGSQPVQQPVQANQVAAAEQEQEQAQLALAEAQDETGDQPQLQASRAERDDRAAGVTLLACLALTAVAGGGLALRTSPRVTPALRTAVTSHKEIP